MRVFSWVQFHTIPSKPRVTICPGHPGHVQASELYLRIFLIVQKWPGLWTLSTVRAKQGWPKSLESTWKAVERWNEFGKITSPFTASGSKSNATVLAAEGTFAFHTVKHSNSMKCSCADRPVKMWRLSETGSVLILKVNMGMQSEMGTDWVPETSGNLHIWTQLSDWVHLNSVAMKASRHKHRSRNKTASCTTVMYKRTYPDSDITRRFSSAQAKTEVIITSVNAPPAV